MAFLRLSGLLTSITGKLNGSYFSYKRGATTMNRCGTKLTRADSGRTALQQSQQRLGYQAQQWATLSDAERLSWQGFAGTLTWKNKAGFDYTPSGYEVYVSCNLNLVTLGVTTINEPVVSSGDGDITAAGVGWNIGGEMVFKYPPSSPSNQGVIIFASAACGFGVAAPRGGYKQIYSASSFVSGDTVLGDAYKDVYGYKPLNCLIFFKIIFIVPDSGIQNGTKLTKADSGFL